MFLQDVTKNFYKQAKKDIAVFLKKHPCTVTHQNNGVTIIFKEIKLTNIFSTITTLAKTNLTCVCLKNKKVLYLKMPHQSSVALQNSVAQKKKFT